MEVRDNRWTRNGPNVPKALEASTEKGSFVSKLE
jgi:hypothetical protein